jgi:muramoyltetrapeptide carboxypeptidase
MMDRKKFISSIVPLAAGFTGILPKEEPEEPVTKTTIPPYLKKGDTVGITCPAGFITSLDILPAVNKLTEWGFEIKIGDTVGKRDFTFGGTDEERRNDFQQMLDDKKIKAILCARGGYGAVRIIDALDFKELTLHPKWIIGFSDITVIHSHLNHNYSIASIHSKMCNSFPADWSLAEDVQKASIESIYKCLLGEKMKYEFVPNAKNKTGIASGALVGGNLKTLESLAGSNSDLVTKNKILFIEDTGEYLYSIDRMLWNLKRTGKLTALAGMIVGGFKIKPDDPGEEFGKALEDIVLEKVKEYNSPVAFDFPVGHQKNNVALKCGVKHQLSLLPSAALLNEI